MKTTCKCAIFVTRYMHKEKDGGQKSFIDCISTIQPCDKKVGQTMVAEALLAIPVTLFILWYRA